MFIETIDKLVAEFQQRLGTKISVPWGWFFTKLATLLTRYPTGVTKAIMFSELECSWRKIEKLQSKGGMNSADSLRSIVLSKHLSPQAVFHVSFKEVKTVEGTHTRIAVVEECNVESSFTMEMYLHKKLYAEVDEIMANDFKLRFTGCRLLHGRRTKLSRLLPSESFVVLVNAEAAENFCQNLSSLEGVLYILLQTLWHSRLALFGAAILLPHPGVPVLVVPVPQYREWTVGPLNWNLGVRACRITHLITIIAASQLHVLANENAKLAGCSQ